MAFPDNLYELVVGVIFPPFIFMAIAYLIYLILHAWWLSYYDSSGNGFIYLIVVILTLIIVIILVISYYSSKRKFKKNLEEKSIDDAYLVKKISKSSEKNPVIVNIYGLPTHMDKNKCLFNREDLIEFLYDLNNNEKWDKNELDEFIDNIPEHSYGMALSSYCDNPPKQVIRKILVRDNYTCQVCGANIKNNYLNAPNAEKYIISKKSFMKTKQLGFLNEKNLITVCKQCERNLHRSSIKSDSENKRIDELHNEINIAESNIGKYNNDIDKINEKIKEIDIENENLDKNFEESYYTFRDKLNNVENIYYDSGATEIDIETIFGSYIEYIEQCRQYWDSANELLYELDKNKPENITLSNIQELHTHLNNYLNGIKIPPSVMKPEVANELKDKKELLNDLVNDLEHGNIYKNKYKKYENESKKNKSKEYIEKNEEIIQNYKKEIMEKKAIIYYKSETE